MLNKLKNRLILFGLLIFFLLSCINLYLKFEEKQFLDALIFESNTGLKKTVINYLSQFPGFNEILGRSKENSNYKIPLDNFNHIVFTYEKNIGSNGFEILNKLHLLIGSVIEKIDPGALGNIIKYVEDRPYLNYVFMILYDKSGKEINFFLLKKESPVVKAKYTSLNREYILTIIFFSIFTVGIIAVIFLQYVKPISLVISSFESKKPELLKKLKESKNEFGILVRLIKEFFEQQQLLEEEIKVKKITQEELETLNDELEKRVSDRTEELEATNIALQKERDQSKQYLDIAGTLIAILDVDGYIKLLNKKGEEVLGYQPGELLGKNWYEVCLADKDREKYKKMHDDIIWGRSEPIEYFIAEVTTKAKEIKTLIFHNTYLEDSLGKYTGIIFSAEDITALKLKEKELIEAKEKADESNRLKSTFLANMSHELRTPMIGILGFSDLLMNELQSEKQKKMVTAIHDSGQRLIDTLNLILDLSRLEANKHNINYQVVNLCTLVKNVAFLFEAAAGSKKLFIKTTVPAFDVIARSDPKMIRDVLNNLINNAIKFTNTGGIFISLDMFQRDFIISIRDTGIGIAKENLDLIFEEFRQASEGLGRGFQGTGLGLTICKKYVEMLGGQISVKSTPNEGSEFIIQLPLISDSELSSESSIYEESNSEFNSDSNNVLSTDTSNLNKFQILVVEDDSVSREIINLFLKDKYSLYFAANGNKAIEFAVEEKFDLIIMDINLGAGITGIEVKDKIKSIAGYEKTPIIAATAFAMIGDREKFLEGGFDHYISKPYLKHQLLKLIEESLRS